MEIFWNIFETLVTVFESFISVRFVLKFQGYNFSVTSAKLKYIYSSLGFAILVIALTYLVPYDGILGFVYVMYLFIISVLLTETKIFTKIFVSIINNLIALAVAAALSGMLSVAFHKPLNELFFEMSWVRFLLIVVGQFLKVFIFDLILKTFNKDSLKLGKKEWALILTVFGISFAAIVLIQIVVVQLTTPSAILLAAELCSMAVAAVCFYMTILLNKSHQESERLRLTAQQEEFRLQYAQNVKKQYEEISRVRHDMKQTNSVVMSLLMEEKTKEAIEYMQKTAKQVSDFDVVIDVGNDFVNAILNAKLSEAKRNGITVLCSADKNASGIDDVDLCNLLGNLLDNAIEACEKCHDRQRVIEIKLRMSGDKYLLEVENTAAENALESNKQLATTKDDTSRHGYGIKSIKSIAEKYNGMVDFSQQGDRFRSVVVMPINK